MQQDRMQKTSIMTGLVEAVADAKSEEKKLTRRVVSVVPVKDYDAKEIQKIRKKTGLSQKLFARYMGVLPKTVEAGINRPSGAASRILSMMEMDAELTIRYPFVQGAERR